MDVTALRAIRENIVREALVATLLQSKFFPTKCGTRVWLPLFKNKVLPSWLDFDLEQGKPAKPSHYQLSQGDLSTLYRLTERIYNCIGQPNS